MKRGLVPGYSAFTAAGKMAVRGTAPFAFRRCREYGTLISEQFLGFRVWFIFIRSGPFVFSVSAGRPPRMIETAVPARARRDSLCVMHANQIQLSIVPLRRGHSNGFSAAI